MEEGEGGKGERGREGGRGGRDDMVSHPEITILKEGGRAQMRKGRKRGFSFIPDITKLQF